MKLITFAVPCFNSAEYMDKCIQSLLKAGEEAEILIVNDGSEKDNTAEIADRYQAEYPTICRAIHKPNGGHGDAVNFGLKNATGKYFKVVDSDDWVDEQALYKVLETLRSFEDKEEYPDVLVSNFVYEYAYNNTQRLVTFKKMYPENQLFEFEESKYFDRVNFMAMHSITYRTELLRSINLELPKHTFYVDNIFVYVPLPYVKKLYYLPVDFYRYFIGRPDQSVQEQVQMKRIDQHIRVTEIIINSHDINEFETTRPKLYDYMLSYILIMMTINSIFLIKMGGKENMAKKKKLWDDLKAKDPQTYKRCRRRFTGLSGSNNRLVCWFCKVVYVFARKILKFN